MCKYLREIHGIAQGAADIPNQDAANMSLPGKHFVDSIHPFSSEKGYRFSFQAVVEYTESPGLQGYKVVS
jgi:hypothetical protein